MDLLAGRLHTPYMIGEAQPLSSTSQKRWSWAGVHPALGWPVPPPRAPLLPSGHRSTFLCVDSGASQIRIKNPGHQTRSPPQAGEGQGPRPWPWPFSALPNLPPALAQRGPPPLGRTGFLFRSTPSSLGCNPSCSLSSKSRQRITTGCESGLCAAATLDPRKAKDAARDPRPLGEQALVPLGG